MSGLYVGVVQKKAEQAETLARADIIWTTASMAFMGLDAADVDGVGLFCHTSIPEQPVGRGLRLMWMPAIPIFVYIHDTSVSCLSRCAQETRKYFQDREKWKVYDARSVKGASVGVDVPTIDRTPFVFQRRRPKKSRTSIV